MNRKQRGFGPFSVGRLAPILVAVAAVCGSTSAAGAKIVDHQTGRIDVTIPHQKLCNIHVSTHIVGSNPTQVKAVRGYLLFSNTGHLTATFTTSDGRWVQNSFSGPAKDLSVTPQGGNVIVVRTEVAGIGLALLASNGDAVSATGRRVIDTTIDDNGTPLNPDDDQVLDVHVVSISGANNAPIDFCAFFTDHLG